MNNFLSVIRAFSLEGTLLEATPYGCGHINHTYRLRVEQNGCEKQYILQKINAGIFKDIAGLMNNIQLISAHIRNGKAGSDAERCALSIVPTKEGSLFYQAEDGACYRIYRFIEHTVTLQSVSCHDDFETLGRAFGEFQNQLSDFDASLLVETIPHFHHTVKRFEALEEAIRQNLAGRADTVAEEIAFARARKDDAARLLTLWQNGQLPLRVTHNDTKLNNVLFDETTHEAVCIVDLDTVMPGFVHYDFGDSIRFGASTAAEDEKDLSKVTMDLSLFEAYTRGFLSACGKALTETEVDQLAFSAKLLTYECGIRFLTDYLNGDTYFRIHYPEQNLDRCRTQFKLVSDMEVKMTAMEDIVRRLSPAR